MTRLTQYSEAFWGPEFLSTAGFDTLSRHNGDDKKFLQEFEEYLRKRSKMELEYGRALGQLAKSLKDRSSHGVLGAAWNCLRGELEACKQSHEEAGLYFTHHAEETKKFCRQLTARRDMVEERVKKAQSQKASQFKNVNSLNKTYRQKCREKDQATDAHAVLRREVTSTVKDLEKARNKMEKSEDDALKADNAYKNAVVSLEDSRQDWEREMEWACKELQESDEEQITFLRLELWMAVNKISQVAYEVDQSCEHVRQVLETCDVDQDIQSFIIHNTTGTERPEPVVYQNYYDTSGAGTANHRMGSASSSSSLDNAHHRPPKATPTLPSHASSAVYSVAYEEDMDPTYSTVSHVSPPPSVLTVSRSFQSAPLTVQAGEKVTFVRKVNANMVEVRTIANKTGPLPVTCIKESL